ncbi:hypothetical protein C7410_103277 [Paraburkholderia silvatlantica]|uniref:Uncharacterized protein n=1 Tax=Paraburkholderia silvatlantica TaxID=321895 RepID=A0A2V4TYA7_9BURK|nr:hypothetical protein [Paraburkholderia silvatlantica]PYE26358.1 hypothetical protein C7410_103277 [Paraburkholderia silvatlantica]
MLNWIKNLIGVYRVIREVPTYFLLFLILNLVFGALGLWLPPMLAAADLHASSLTEFTKAMRAGNGYLFCLPLLASASMYVFREYKESKNSEFKDIKLMAFFLALGLMVAMALFLAPCVIAQFDLPQSVPSEQQIRSPIGNLGIGLQMLLTLLGLTLAIFMFCLESIDDFQEYGIGLKDKTRKKLEQQMENAESNSGLKL